MCELYDEFPNLCNDKIEIRKMVEGDVAALQEISHSDAVYRYISPFCIVKAKNSCKPPSRILAAEILTRKR